jgi:hypothetical protein
MQKQLTVHTTGKRVFEEKLLICYSKMINKSRVVFLITEH